MEMPLQGGDVEVVEVPPPLSPASAAAAARWIPTREQVAVLERLYEHGMRTPSAEQIKQITARLREHGHVERKSVSYWFQNHKARLRQKQKQDAFAFFSTLLRRPPPLPMLFRPPGLPVPVLAPPAMGMTMAPPPPAACNNYNNGGTHGMMYRAPFYMPAPPSNPAYYHHLLQQQQQMPALYPRMEVANMIPTPVPRHQRHHPGGAMYQYKQAAAPSNSSSAPIDVDALPSPVAGADAGPSRQTLQLFPLEPTFLLSDKGRAAAAAASQASASFSEESEVSDGEAPALPFYDFLGLQSGGR